MGSNIKSRSASKVALESFDDLFGGNTAQENGIEQIINAPLAELYTFKDHPFRVADDVEDGGNNREYPPVRGACAGDCKTEGGRRL